MKKVGNREKTANKGMVPLRWIVLWCMAAAVLITVCILLIVVTEKDDGFPVRFSEVSASNTAFPNEDGRICDYIELHNRGDYNVDLTGFSIGDLDGSTRYDFAPGTVMEAGAYLVIWCDSSVTDEGYASFGISRSGGEEYCLITESRAIADRVITTAMDADESMVPDANGNWTVTSTQTPGYANSAAADEVQDLFNPDVSPVRITEISSLETWYVQEHKILTDWVELYNTAKEEQDVSGFILSDNVGNDKYILPEGTVIPGESYLVIACSGMDDLTGTASFAFSTLGGEDVVLKTEDGRIVELVHTVPMTAGSQQFTEDGWGVTKELSPGYANTAEGHIAFLESIGADEGRITITEISNGEQYLLSDGCNGFSDWVEIHNSGDVPVNLAGWSMTDNAADGEAWMFPEFLVPPDGYAVVFCSGSGTVNGGTIHTDFALASGGETVSLFSSAGTLADEAAFGQAKQNHSFVAEDDGSMTLCECPTPGYTNDEEGYHAFCKADIPTGPLAIWEVMTANDWYLPQTLGECYDWVEILNVSEETVLLSDYCISDDADDPDMHKLPERNLAPGETAVIILSGDTTLSTEKYDHASFALNAAADKLLLYKADGTLLDHVWLEDLPYGMSYGRSAEEGGFFYMQPSPNSPNAQGNRQISAAPVSEVLPGVYTDKDSYIVPLEAAGTIYYTLDGSDPDLDSFLYEEPLNITETTVLRAAAVENGKLISDIYTATFIIGEERSLPVVSLVTDPGNLWGSGGIYQNFMEIKEESRIANVAYSGDDGSFSIGCEISLHGATTVTAFSKKSFTVRFQDRYDGPLHYDVFEDGEVVDFRSLILRAAHESSVSTHMHDVLMAELAAGACDTVITQKYKYTALYINGEYWGLYAIREHHSPTHYASYMHVPAEGVSMVRFATDEINGLNEVYEFCKANDLSVPENYAYVESRLDLTSFADWTILQAYAANFDINGNIRYYMSPSDGKWRCGLSDLDLGFFDYTVFDGVVHTFHHGTFIYNLTRNEEFCSLLGERLSILLSGPLSDSYVSERIDDLAESIREEVARDGERWGYDPKVWEVFVADMHRFCSNRAEKMIDSFCSEFGYTPAEQERLFGSIAEV